MPIHWKEIDRLVRAHKAVKPTSSEEDLLRQLQIWWCINYNRPLKDPMLDSYTLDELAYEYLVHHYLKPENDPERVAQDKDALKADEEWAKKMLEGERKKREAKKASDIQAPPTPTEPQVPEIPSLPELSTNFDG